MLEQAQSKSAQAFNSWALSGLKHPPKKTICELAQRKHSICFASTVYIYNGYLLFKDAQAVMIRKWPASAHIHILSVKIQQILQKPPKSKKKKKNH